MLRLRNDDHPLRMARLLANVAKKNRLKIEEVQFFAELKRIYGEKEAETVLSSLQQGQSLFEVSFSPEKREAMIKSLGSEKAKDIFRDSVRSSTYASTMVELAYEEHGKKSFLEEDDLHFLLDKSDLGEVPTSMLRLPFPAIYISLSREQDKHFIFNSETGKHKVCGVYLYEHEPEIGVHQFHYAGEEFKITSFAPEDTIRQISVVVVALANENSKHEHDDAFQYVELSVREDETFEQAFEREGKYGSGDKFGENRGPCTEVMKHVFKFLLYLNTRDMSEFESFGEHSELAKKLSKSKGKRRDQLKKRLARASDVIYVKHTDGSGEVSSSRIHQGQSKSAHYRRGHFKSVAHGKGRLLRKIVWIEPTIVNKDALTSDRELINKAYHVK